jgi:hypothetical protein
LLLRAHSVGFKVVAPGGIIPQSAVAPVAGGLYAQRAGCATPAILILCCLFCFLLTNQSKNGDVIEDFHQ